MPDFPKISPFFFSRASPLACGLPASRTRLPVGLDCGLWACSFPLPPLARIISVLPPCLVTLQRMIHLIYLLIHYYTFPPYNLQYYAYTVHLRFSRGGSFSFISKFSVTVFSVDSFAIMVNVSTRKNC